MAKYVIESTTLTNIAEAIREKNGSTTEYKPSEMPAAISAIETGSSSDEWQPQSDWWGIDDIIENDTEEYPGKIIVLLKAEDEVQNFVNLLGSDKIVTSDGGTITTTGDYTWDITKDKECSLGYKTRYLIFYYSSTKPNIAMNNTIITNSLYIIFSGIEQILSNSAPANSFFYQLYLIECIKTLNEITFNPIANSGMSGCNSLRKAMGSFIFLQTSSESSGTSFIDNNTNMTNMDDFGFSFPNYTSIRALFYAVGFNVIDLQKWDISPSNITNMFSAFGRGVYEIEELDFANVTNINSSFGNAFSLRRINNISNIKIPGLDFNKCVLLEHDTLLRILNALYDYASEGSTDTYTLKLGTTNLTKLTDEEKAIATNKGWTLN